MGAEYSCELDHMSNLCDMDICIREIKGRPSSSLSDTDTWIAALRPETMFNGEYVSRTFLKIGVSPASVRIQPGDEDTFPQRLAIFQKRMKASLGLRYEFQVYERIIRPILDGDVCLLFLRPYLASYNCRYEDLRATLDVGLRGQPRAKVTAALNRNLSFIIKGPKVQAKEEEVKEEAKDQEPQAKEAGETAGATTGAKAEAKAQTKPQSKVEKVQKIKPERRKAIHDLPSDDEVFEPPSPNVRYMVLATQYNLTIPYYEFLMRQNDPYAEMVVAVQILIGLYVMQKSRLMHNDLHGFNILLEPYSKPQIDTYKIDNLPAFTISISYRVKIFDFDHASCDLLGINPLWITDGFESNKDLACLYRWMLPHGRDIVVKSVFPQFFDTQQVDIDFEEATAEGERDLRWCDAKGAQIKGSILNALERLGSYFNSHFPMQEDALPFVINDDMFMLNGELYKDHHLKARSRQREAHHKELSQECMTALQKCQQERKELTNRLAEMEANIQQLQKAQRQIRGGTSTALSPQPKRPHQ